MAQEPADLDRRRVRELIRGLPRDGGIGPRIDIASRALLGCPYRACPLGGSSESEEVLTASVDAFDCVTYVETVLALALSSTVPEFVLNLRLIRYRAGDVGWKTRNHYMTGWIRENARGGRVRTVAGPGRQVRRKRQLDVVEGIPERRVTVTSTPKQDFLRNIGHVSTGDVAFFASTRRHLDIFHCGILVRVADEVRLRHAARSRGRVVEQPLEDFLRQNRMTGVILTRPVEPVSQAA